MDPTDTTTVNDPIVITTDALTTPITEDSVNAGFVVADIDGDATDEDGGAMDGDDLQYRRHHQRYAITDTNTGEVTRSRRARPW